MNKEILDRLALQSLSNFLGYDEGKLYFEIINKIDTPAKTEHSHSKKYRILKKLQELSVIAKIGSDIDSTRYFPMPPTFVADNKIDKIILNHLEDIYLKKHYLDLLKILNNKQMIYISFKGLKNNSLILFLLKYFMKDYAIILMGGTSEFEYYLHNLDPGKLNKIKYFYREDYFTENLSLQTHKLKSSKIGNKRLALIDGNILIEFLKFPNAHYFYKPEETLFIGYMVGSNFEISTPSGKINYIKSIEREIKETIS